MKTQPNLDERDQFDELLQAVGKSVVAKPDKGWDGKDEPENNEQIEKTDSEKQD